MKKPELTVVERAQAMGDRSRVVAFLDHIGETSKEGRAQVLDACANGYEHGTAQEVRAFFISRFNNMGAHDRA